MVVVHITASTEFLAVLRTHIEVETEVLAGGDTAVVAKAREARGTAVGEVLAIGVVATSNESELVAVGEVVCHQIAAVSVVGAVATCHGAKPAVVHALLHREVDHRFVLTVVNARKARQVAFAVDNLEFVHHVGRNVFRSHFRVVAEEFLTVDKDFRHLLAVGCNLAVAAHLHARHTLQQVFHHSVGLGFVGVGVVFYGVFLHRDRRFHAVDHGFLQENALHFHRNGTKVHVATGLFHGHAACGVVVAQIGAFQHIASGRHIFKVEEPIAVGDSAHHIGAVFVGLEQLHRGRYQR